MIKFIKHIFRTFFVFYNGQKLKSKKENIRLSQFKRYVHTSTVIFNNEIILGDARKESLYDIWNGERYQQFRKDHFEFARGIKCTEQCDMKLVGNYFV